MHVVTVSIGTFSLPLSNNCFENVADDESCCRCTRILVVILNETKEKKLIKLYRLRLIARAIISNDIRTPDTPASRDGHAESDFSLVPKVQCAKFYQDLWKISSGSECRAPPDTPASTISKFLNFQNH